MTAILTSELYQEQPQHQGVLYQAPAQLIPALRVARPLTIYLPPGYEESRRRYPVAYMLDGQNLFGDEGSYSGGWHLHEVLDRRAVRGKVVPIVVGIHNGGEARLDEFSPWPVESGRRGLGGQLLEWVVGPLAETIAGQLRVLKGPAHTLIGGSSLGGLMALYGVARYPEVFGRALCLSPSL